MTYRADFSRSWVNSSHPSTRADSRSPSPTPRYQDEQNGGPTTLDVSPHLVEHLVRYAARAEHLPGRGAYAERSRLLRSMYGYPPLGSAADADEISDEEEALEQKRLAIARFGHRHISQVGRRRTAHEEDLSNEEDNQMEGRGDGDMDREGGPGQFVGGHTGHAAAQLLAAQRAAAEAREAAQRQAAVQATERAAPAAGTTRVQEAESAAADWARQEEEARQAMQEEVDLDADIEDLDD